MADDTERLVVMLEARLRDFEKNMAKASATGTRTYQGLQRGSTRATRQMEQDMARASSRINQALSSGSARIGAFGKAFVGGIAGGAIVAAFSGLNANIGETIKGIASIGDEAKRAGMSAKSFQEWKFVAEQNRIGVDALVDGFKELNLRADEFVVTGGGSAAESFLRLGYSADELKVKLKDPSALMLEIIGRLGQLDEAAQIRISDELFGGSAGERFVELIGQGEAGIAKTIGRAHELGAVMDAEMIQKAADLDRKFGEVAQRIESMWQAGVVGAAEFFGLIEDKAEVAAEKLVYNFDAAQRDIANAIRAIGDEIPNLLELGADELAMQLADVVAEMESLAGQFSRSEIEAGAFETAMEAAITSAGDLLTEAQKIDGVDMSNAVGAVGRVAGALAAAFDWARALNGELDAAAGGGPKFPGKDADDMGVGVPTSPLAPSGGRAGRPADRPGVDSLGDFLDHGSAGGGGGGGRGAAAYTAAAGAIRDETAALEAEAAVLVAVASSGLKYGDAMEYARKRADLLLAAQQDGKIITPELLAEIDALAAGYDRAGRDAEGAADHLKRVQDNAERGGKAISEMLASIASGTKKPLEALKELLLQMVAVNMQRRVMGWAATGGAGLSGIIGGLLSMDGGGYTGNGSRSGGLDGKGGFLAVMHPRETVTDHAKGGSRAGVNAPSGVAATAVVPQRVEVRMIGGDLTLTDDGKIAAHVRTAAQVAAQQGAAGAVQHVRNSLPGWSRQLQADGTL